MQERIYLSPPTNMIGVVNDYIKEEFNTNGAAGINIVAFENEICRLTGTKYAVALSSGAKPLLFALKTMGVGVADVVFCSDFTLSESCVQIKQLGAEPVFIDSEPYSCNMSPKALERGLIKANRKNKLPKAIIIADMYGIPANYNKLLPICEKYNVPVIEDAAYAFGSIYRGAGCGTFGSAGIFTFNDNKIISTFGKGMLISNDESLISRVRFLSGQVKKPAEDPGIMEGAFNFSLSDECWGSGREQLRELDINIKRRRESREYYINSFRNYPVCFLSEPYGSLSDCNIMVIIIYDIDRNPPERIIKALSDNNIETQTIIKPMHETPVFSKAKLIPHYSFKNSISSDIYKRAICLPCGENLTENQLALICNTIKSVLSK